MNIDVIIKSEKKKYRLTFIICIILTILAIIALILGDIIDKNEREKAKYFDRSNIGILSYIEPTNLSNPFYYHENKNQSYRFIKDKFENYYIVNVYESRVEDIKKYDSKLYGKPKKLNDKTIKYLTEQYKKIYSNITEEKIKEVYGIYFDASDEEGITSLLLIVFGVIFLILAPFFFIIYLCLYISFRSSIKKLDDEIIEEVNKELSGNQKKFDKLNIILTDNYLITHSKKLLFYKYSDIFMIYKQKVRTQRITNYFLYVVDKSGKAYQISTLHQFAVKHLSEFDAVIDKVVEKNPKVLTGQNSENNRLLKEFRKDLKKNKKNKITN